MHARGKAQCLELIYPTGGTDDNVEQIACARFEFGSVMVYNWADEVRPIYPAGTILHVINWHDNSANKNNPDPRNWVGNGNRTIDEMSFSWVNYYNLTDSAYRQMLAARKRSQKKGTSAAGATQPPAAAHRAPRAPLLPTNVPVFRPQRPPAGLSVSVIVYRGPAAGDVRARGVHESEGRRGGRESNLQPAGHLCAAGHCQRRDAADGQEHDDHSEPAGRGRDQGLGIDPECDLIPTSPDP